MPADLWYTTLAALAKLMISAVSGRFRGLGPTIFGSREDFDALGTPIHDSSDIGETRDIGHF